MRVAVILDKYGIQEDALFFFSGHLNSLGFKYEIINLLEKEYRAFKIHSFSRFILNLVIFLEKFRFGISDNQKVILSRFRSDEYFNGSLTGRTPSMNLPMLQDYLNLQNYDFVIVFDALIANSILDYEYKSQMNLITIQDLNCELGKISRNPLKSSINRVDFTTTTISYTHQKDLAKSLLFHGRIPTQKYSFLNQKYVNGLLLDNLENVLTRFSSGKNQIVETVNGLESSLPTFVEILNYFLFTNLTAIRNYFLKLWKRKETWHIYISRHENHKIKSQYRLVNPNKGFLADPFLISHNNQIFCFFENFDDSISRGKISYINVDAPELIYTALEEDFHLSYPFIFNYSDSFYMIPETSERNQIRLYMATKFPSKWEFVRVLVDSVDAVDVAIYFRDGLWWMLFTTAYAGLKDHSSQLNLYYSNDLISGEWLASPHNPILVDGESARNAGRVGGFEHLFRIFQRQGYSAYGKSIGATKILDLEDRNFVEKEIDFPYINLLESTQWIHHMDLLEDVLVFDRFEKS